MEEGRWVVVDSEYHHQLLAKLTKRVGSVYFHVNLNVIKNKLLNLHLHVQISFYIASLCFFDTVCFNVCLTLTHIQRRR